MLSKNELSKKVCVFCWALIFILRLYTRRKLVRLDYIQEENMTCVVVNDGFRRKKEDLLFKFVANLVIFSTVDTRIHRHAIQ